MGAEGANLAVEHQMHWTTTRFKYQGSTGFDGDNSYIDVFAGASHTALHLTGTLKGLPPGTGGIHIHQGCDEDDSKTIGGHFWESSSECSTNPWKSVQYTAVEGSAFELDVEVNAGVHWAETLGRTVVIHSPDGSRLAVASLRPASDIPVSADASLRLPPFLSFELYEPAVCQEDYAPAKACAASSIADSCVGPSAAGSSCGHVARNHRWCDTDSSLTLKATADITRCAVVVIQVRVHNSPFQQRGVNVTVAGHGPGLYIEPTMAMDSDPILTSASAPGFASFEVDELPCRDSVQCVNTSSTGGFRTDLAVQGGCVGMSNVLTVRFTPNIDLDSGSLITISGLMRVGYTGQTIPDFVASDGHDFDLGVSSWNETTGTIILSLLETACLEPATMKAGREVEFKLNMEMPQATSSITQKARPSISASLPASRPAFLEPCTAEARHACVLAPRSSDKAAVLFPRASTDDILFVARAISQETCLPNKCSRLTVAFSSNRHLSGGSLVILSGLEGMDFCASCSSGGSGVCDPKDQHDFEGESYSGVALADSAQSNHNQRFASLRERNSEGSWHSGTKSLLLRVEQGTVLEAYRTYSVSFTLKNNVEPAAVDLQSSVKISAYGQTPESPDGTCYFKSNTPSTVFEAITACDGEPVMTSGACGQSSSSLQVCAPDIDASIRQDHPWPGCGGSYEVDPAVIPGLAPFSPFNVSRGTAYTESEKEQRCAQEKRVCNLRNKITLSMTPNIPVPAQSVVTVAGLLNAIDLKLDGASLPFITPGTFTFDADSFEVTFQVNATWNETQDVVFDLINPHGPQPSPNVTLRVAWTIAACDNSTKDVVIHKAVSKALSHTSAQKSTIIGSLTQAVENSTLGSLLGVGDAEVLRVQEPRWIIKSVGASSTDPSANNTISVTLAANVELRKGATITLTGLTGFSSADANLTLSESSALPVPTCHKNGNESSSTQYSKMNVTTALESTGVWNQHAGSLVVTLARTVNVKGVLKFSFVLTNPCTEQQHSQLELEVNDDPWTCAIDCSCPQQNVSKLDDEQVSESYRLDCNETVSSFESTVGCKNTRTVTKRRKVYELRDGNCTCQHALAGNNCPAWVTNRKTVLSASLDVKKPAFSLVSGSWATDSCWPQKDVCATVTFTANVKLDGKSKVYIGGFSGAAMKNISHIETSTKLLVDQAHSNGPFSWDSARKTLTLSYDNTAVDPNTQQNVTLCFQNPGRTQRAPEISIWADSLCGCEVSIAREEVVSGEGCGAILMVEAPRFVVKSIAQCHPNVNALNTISATISTNVPLGHPRKVTISGLVGSATPDNKALKVYGDSTVDCNAGCSGNSSSVFENTGPWSKERGMLVLHIREGATVLAGVNYTIQFQLQNPPAEQQAPAVSVSACTIGAARMEANGTEPSDTCAANAPKTAPLMVLRPRIVTKKIGQSTMAPGEVNVLTVTLAVNTHLRPDLAEGVLVISGFNQAHAPCGPMALFDVAGSLQSAQSTFMSPTTGVPGTGLWDCNQSSLTLHVAAELQPCQNYVFSFRVTNPMCSQTCSPLNLTTQHLEFRAQGCGASEDCKQLMPSGFEEVLHMDSDTGNFCPMTVVAPSLTVMKVTECSRVCDAANKLDVVLQANVPMDVGTTITIGGAGLMVHDGCLLDSAPALDASGVFSIQGKDAGLFAGKATVVKDSCQLQLDLSERLPANTPLEVCFSVFNPECPPDMHDAAGIALSVWAVTPDFSLGPYAMAGLVLSGKDKPSFELAEITESSSVQRSANTLKVLFRANVDVEAGSVVSVSGLTGTSTPPGASDLSLMGQEVTGMSSHYFRPQVEWDPQTGTVKATASSAIPAKTTVIFAFEVQNGDAQEAVQAYIAILRPVMGAGASAKTCGDSDADVEGGTEGIPRTRLIGAVLANTCSPSLQMKKIGQSTPYPNAMNMLTVTVATNFDFRARTGDKVVCTLTGLAGAPAATPGEITLFGADPFASGCMFCQCASASDCNERSASADGLTFHIASDMDAGCPYSFSFEVQNPNAEQGHPDMTLSCTWNDGQAEFSTDLDHDVCSKPDEKYVVDPSVGEAAALVVRSHSFSAREITQSSSSPCDDNTICVTISATVPMSEEQGDILVISGLDDAIATTGALDLIAQPGSSAKIDEDLRSSGSDDAVKGTGHWDNEEKTLTMWVRCKLQAGQALTFCFKVRNPVESRDAATPQISIQGNTPVAMTKKADATKRTHPMYVEAPRFTRLTVDQTSPFPCDQNSITVAFTLNVGLYSKCKPTLTCSGFVNSMTSGSGLNMTLSNNGTAQHANATLAQWVQTTGAFTLDLSEAASGNMQSSTDYSLDFSLKNPNQGQDAEDIACRIRIEDYEYPEETASPCGSQIPARLDGTDLAEKVCRGTLGPCTASDGCPLTVHTPSFVAASIGQSTDQPGASNKLCVTMAVNTELFEEGSTIKFTGFAHDQSAKKMAVGASYGIGFGGSGHGSDGIDAPDLQNSANYNATFYVMFTAQNVRERWPDTLHNRNADHLVSVKATTTANVTGNVTRNVTAWEVFAKGSWVAFEPVGTDLIVAKVQYNDSVPEQTCQTTHGLDRSGNKHRPTETVSCTQAGGGTGVWVVTNLGTQAELGVAPSIPQGSHLCDGSNTKQRCTDVVVSVFDQSSKRDALHCPNHLALKVTGDFIMPFGVVLEGADADLFVREGAVGASESELTIEVAAGQKLSLGQSYSVCFYAQNPMQQAEGYSIFVSSSSCADIAPTRMDQSTNPLQVAAKALTVSAYQSSPFPCTANTITLDLLANFHIRSGAVITLTGLANADVSSLVDGRMPLADASGGYDHSELFRRAGDDPCDSELGLCAATGQWTSSKLTLTVAAGKNLVAGERYAISFEITNPEISSIPSYESAASLRIGLDDSITDVTLTNVEVNAAAHHKTLGLCGNDKVDEAPMFIYEPTFTVSKIGHSSARPCEPSNNVTVTLKSNMPVCPESCNSVLTLTGLTGATLPDGPVQLRSTNQNDHTVFAATDDGDPGFGMWSSADETLTLFLTCCLECNQEYEFSFAVKNPSCAQAAPAISITGSGVTDKQLVSTPAGPHAISTTDPAAPLGILQPTFTRQIWSESSTVPCDNNTFSITLASNIPVPSLTTLTIAGLQDTATSMNELRVLPAGRSEYVNSSSDAVETTSGFNYSKAVWDNAKSLSEDQNPGANYAHRRQLLEDLQCQMVEENCPGPFTSCTSVIAHRGAPKKYPDHTQKGYEKAMEMGACRLSCEAVFNKDNELYCRKDRCDLHETTDILTNPENDCLAKKCSTPGVTCCTSDFTAAELARLCVTKADDPSPAGTCHKIMSHKAFVQLGVAANKSMVTELLYYPDEARNQTKAAENVTKDYQSAGASSSDVFLQSSHRAHVELWLSRADFNQAVWRILRSSAQNAATQLDELAQLTSRRLQYVSADVDDLLQCHDCASGGSKDTSKERYGSFEQTALARHAKQHGYQVWAMGMSSDRLAPAGNQYISKEADSVLLLHALMSGTADRVFSDWAESVSHYENCVAVRTSSVQGGISTVQVNFTDTATPTISWTMSDYTAQWEVGSLERKVTVTLPTAIEQPNTYFKLSFVLEVSCAPCLSCRALDHHRRSVLGAGLARVAPSPSGPPCTLTCRTDLGRIWPRKRVVTRQQ